MEKTVGMRIRECRIKMGITQEELAPILGTSVSYLAGGEACGLSPEVLQVAMLLEGMENKELRRVALEQVKILAGVRIN